MLEQAFDSDISQDSINLGLLKQIGCNLKKNLYLKAFIDCKLGAN